MLCHANELLGCWQGEKVSQFLADGRSHEQASGGGVIEFTASEIVTWRFGSLQPVEIRYRYAIVRPGVYAATLTAHSVLPDTAGSAREYEYKVEGDLLYITTYPQTTRPAPLTAAVKVESRSRRIACTTTGQPAPAATAKP